MNSNERLARVRWDALAAEIGSRYADCTVENFRCESQEQRAAAAAVRGFIAEMPQNVRGGAGVFLFGPVGTGKDHLLTALMRAAVDAGASVRWFNGLDLFCRIRDLIGSDASEAGFMESMLASDVLAISDPFSGRAKLTDHQADMLARIVDDRYRAKRSTWVTANVKDRADAEQRLGVPLVDRLGHGCLSINCNWPSYRRGRND